MCNEITENYYRGAGLFRLAFFPNYEITPTENFLKMHIIIYYQQHRIILTKVEEYGLKTRITKNWDFFE